MEEEGIESKLDRLRTTPPRNSLIFYNGAIRHLVFVGVSLVISLGSPRNVLGGPLDECSNDPMTGFFRDGCCRTGPQDVGRHLVCAKMTASFLAFSKSRGNDLSTPAPHYGFPGLKPGDQWCLCAERWKEAYDAGYAPRVVLTATHEKALDYVPLEALVEFAVDGPAAN